MCTKKLDPGLHTALVGFGTFELSDLGRGRLLIFDDPSLGAWSVADVY